MDDAGSPALSDSLSFEFDFEELVEATDNLEQSVDSLLPEPNFAATQDEAATTTTAASKKEANMNEPFTGDAFSMPADASQASLDSFDALSQIVAGYGSFLPSSMAADKKQLLPVGDFDERATTLEMVFSPTNLIVQRAVMESLAAVHHAPVATASPAELHHSPMGATAPPTTTPATPLATNISAEEEQQADANDTAMQKERKKRKRVMDTAKLVPLDAPIQPRQYNGPSATARKEICAEERQEATPAPSSKRCRRSETPVAADPLLSKRLNNTLAARRSRHRKAEELKELHDTISSLKDEVQDWKMKYEEMKRENERLLAARDA